MADENAKADGHETREINVRIVALSALGLVVIALAIFLAVAGLFKLFAREEPSPDRPSRDAFNVRNLAPQPQLQIDPAIDLQKMETANTAKLNSYGWIDKQAGTVRIPIERAMDLIAQRGLPTRGPGTQNASNKTAIQMQQDKAAATASQNPK